MSSEETPNKRPSKESVPILNSRNILSNVYSKDIQTNSYMYKNMVRNNSLPLVSMRPDNNKQGRSNNDGKQK